MSDLYLVSLPVDMQSLYRWSAHRNLAADEGRALHHLLSELFGKGVLQPFRLMVAPGARAGTIYAYSQKDALSLQQTAQESGVPDAAQVCDPARVAAKAMPQGWKEGRRLAFDVRVRPVRRLLRAAGSFAKGAEIDAFLVDAFRSNPAGRPELGGADRGTAYLHWLKERLGSAADVKSARLVHFERSIVHRGNSQQEGPDATFHGELVVTDGMKFAERLAKGVGRHTAYGYGMLLLRPARSG
jgi:CRISPR system Cascade subunit CasE